VDVRGPQVQSGSLGAMATPNVTIRQVGTANLTDPEISAIRELLRAAFQFDGEGFTDDDWEHAAGGTHFLLEQAGAVLAHASVVLREFQADGRPLRTGYVEAVATRPDVQSRGHATTVVRAVNEHIRGAFELGALSTGIPDFYRRLGWELWLGSTAVRTQGGLLPTPEDDGGIMILATPSTPGFDLHGALSCEWRRGDVW
jgi:aminoglycoside 2'-N-acetyltransferase I